MFIFQNNIKQFRFPFSNTAVEICFGTPRDDVDNDVFIFVLIGQNAMT
jgi:hypothetical protein